MKTRFYFLLAILASNLSLITAQSPYWSLSPDAPMPEKSSAWSQIRNVQYVQLDHEAFRQDLLARVPHESISPNGVPVSLPMPDGTFRFFYVTESPVMEPELAAKYPEIKTYKGTDGFNYMRMSISPYSFQAFVLTREGDLVIEAPDKKNLGRYGVFYASDLDLAESIPLSCGTIDLNKISKPNEPAEPQMGSRSGGGVPVDLRTYRLALACTGDWGIRGDLGGGSLATALDKMAASLSYINAVYEKEVSLHFNLTANNDRIINLDPTADPYPTPTSGGGTLGINTDVINAKIGRAAYDFGHVFTVGCTDVGGVAFLGSVCGGNKGGGVTCWYTTDIAYVSLRIACHEMGHQFDASHTFSNCNGNESATSYEPGSGTSIMSYSGLCGAGLNVETGGLPHPNYFHINSVERIINFTRNFQGSTCGVSTPTSNTFPEPEILFPSGLYIPIRTPFKLSGRATDMEGDTLSYNWEQYDAGRYGPILGEPSLTEEGPLFKSLFPGPNPVRVVPAWNTILTKANFERTEVLPTVNRQITFRFNVRDNHFGSGGTAWKQTFFRSVEAAGPFTVQFPNDAQADTLFTNTCNRISWDVSNTNKSPINCRKVNIYLMPNRTITGNIIPLLLNTDNDGEELVDIPDSLSGQSRARIIVEAADNIFFDVSDQDIRIRSNAQGKIQFGLAPKSLQFCVPSSTDIAIRVCSSKDLSGDLQLSIESGLPDNAAYEFDREIVGLNDETTLRLDFSNVRISGIYKVVVIGVTSSGDTLREEIELDLVSIDYSDLQTVFPATGLSGLSQSIEFKWNPSKNAVSYNLEIATSPAFGNTVVYSINGITGSSFKPNFLFDENSLYYWRIFPVNRCGQGGPTTPSPFHTINKSCAEVPYPGNAISRRANQTASMVIPIRESGIISDVNVKNFKASANGVNSVSLTLVSPKGTKVKLFDRNCGVTGEFDCSFDDDGSLTVANGCPPIQGKRIQPLESLSKFVNEDKRGDWHLDIALDNFLSGFANFDAFSLDVCSELVVTPPFLVINLGLQLNPAETKSIGSDLLLSQDPDNGPEELSYTLVVIPQRGDLLINGVAATYGSRFTQKDINDGKISYRHTGSQMETDGFLFTVEDGKGGWFGTEFFKIQIGTVATGDEREDPELSIYPNPTEGLLQVASDKQWDRGAILRIRDLQGRELLRKTVGGLRADQLSIRHLPDGIYVLEIRSNQYYANRKVVLKK